MNKFFGIKQNLIKILDQVQENFGKYQKILDPMMKMKFMILITNIVIVKDQKLMLKKIDGKWGDRPIRDFIKNNVAFKKSAF